MPSSSSLNPQVLPRTATAAKQSHALRTAIAAFIIALIIGIIYWTQLPQSGTTVVSTGPIRRSQTTAVLAGLKGSTPASATETNEALKKLSQTKAKPGAEDTSSVLVQLAK